jgi:hypothetical protein
MRIWDIWSDHELNAKPDDRLAGGVKSQKTRRESQKSQRITEYLSLKVDLMDGIGTHDP